MRAFIDVTLVNVRLRARAHECTIRYPQHKKQWQLSPIKGYSPVHVSKFFFFLKLALSSSVRLAAIFLAVFHSELKPRVIKFIRTSKKWE